MRLTPHNYFTSYYIAESFSIYLLRLPFAIDAQYARPFLALLPDRPAHKDPFTFEQKSASIPSSVGQSTFQDDEDMVYGKRRIESSSATCSATFCFLVV